jgi:hypothetical protein
VRASLARSAFFCRSALSLLIVVPLVVILKGYARVQLSQDRLKPILK